MGFGGAKKVKAKKAKSAFAGVNQADTSLGGFASAVSRKDGNGLSTTSSLDPSLEGARLGAIDAINANQGIFAKSIQDRFRDIEDGNNAGFNLQQELLNRNFDQRLGNLNSGLAQRGISDSSARGVREANLLNDARLQELTAQNAAIQNENSLAAQGLNAGNSQLGLLANLLGLPTQLSNNNLLTALNDQSSTSRFNAQQENNARLQNAQQRGPGTLSRVLGAGIGLLPGVGGILSSAFRGGGSSAGPSASSSVDLGSQGFGNFFANQGGFTGGALPTPFLTPDPNRFGPTGFDNNLLSRGIGI